MLSIRLCEISNKKVFINPTMQKKTKFKQMWLVYTDDLFLKEFFFQRTRCLTIDKIVNAREIRGFKASQMRLAKDSHCSCFPLKMYNSYTCYGQNQKSAEAIIDSEIPNIIFMFFIFNKFVAEGRGFNTAILFLSCVLAFPSFRKYWQKS